MLLQPTLVAFHSLCLLFWSLCCCCCCSTFHLIIFGFSSFLFTPGTLHCSTINWGSEYLSIHAGPTPQLDRTHVASLCFQGLYKKLSEVQIPSSSLTGNLGYKLQINYPLSPENTFVPAGLYELSLHCLHICKNNPPALWLLTVRSWALSISISIARSCFDRS